MESVADGVLAVDRDWNITAFNRSAEAITGISREHALGRKCFDVLRVNVCADWCPMRHALDIDDCVSGRRVTMMNDKGKNVPVSITAAPLRDARGNIVGGVETFRDLSAEEQLRKRLADSYTYHDIVGKSARMRELFKILPAVAESESTTLIEGESGTGKELFARAVHDLSPRSNQPYVIVNCSALPENLLESELFGYRKGAFTDAKKDKPGRFELAQGGSIFLDEIATLTLAVQTKLLRVLEQKVVEPLGGTHSVKTDVRVILASNRSLRDLVTEGKFRDDLFYRLSVVTLELPPLRARRDDIPLLIERVIHDLNVEKRKDISGVSADAMRVLMEHDYPGNVRELQNIIEQAFVLCGNGLICLQHLPRSLVENLNAPTTDAVRKSQPGDSIRARRGNAEAQAIREALSRNGWHRQQTAADLGMSTSSLWRKMKQHQIQPPSPR